MRSRIATNLESIALPKSVIEVQGNAFPGYSYANLSKVYYTASFTGNTYTTTMNDARAGRMVYCVITDKYGNSVQSDAVTLLQKAATTTTTEGAEIVTTTTDNNNAHYG